jgi:hypothetical protein
MGVLHLELWTDPEQVKITKTQQLMCHSMIPELADFQASRI